MSIYLIRFIFLVISFTVLAGCGGGGGSSSGVSINQPNLPASPISSMTLGDDFVGFMIATQPLSVDPSSANSLRFSQQLYELDADNNITLVPMIGVDGELIDFTGNLSYTDVENIIPLDIMVLSPDYLLLTVFHRNFDLNEDNDYFNLLIDLHDGSVTAAPVGLNPEGNSGRSSITTPGRDVFPPDSRWNLSDNLYVVSVDYEELGIMESVDYVPNTDPEIVDHYTEVPCPVGVTPEESEDITDDTETDTTEETTDVTTDESATDTTEDEPAPAGSTCTSTSAEEDSATATATSTTTENATPLTSEAPANSFNANLISNRAAQEETPPPTALYRMDLLEGNQFTLVKVSAEDDRPGLGQVIVSDDGTIIYRNEDGGDNSYRVLLPDCEGVTGRLSTVLLAPFNTLIIAPDKNGVNSVFEVTYAGMNKLVFSCNGNIERIAYTGYSKQVTSLKLPYNSKSIASYDYAYPYFINTSCQSADLFPRQSSFSSILDPMPAIPGLPSSDVRGLRKSQYFNDRLFCIGYDAALELSIAELDPADFYPQFSFLNLDFGLWLPRFNTVHVLSNQNVIFTATSRVSPAVKTILLDTLGTETDLTDTLAGFEVRQQIEITPPSTEYTLPTVN